MANAIKYRMPLIVEFVGLPGAGKTTISKLISDGYGEFYDEKNQSVTIKVINDTQAWYYKRKNWKHFFLLIMKCFIAFTWAIMRPQLLISVLKHSVLLSHQPKLTAFTRVLQFYNCLSYLSWIKLYTRFFDLSIEYLLLDQGVIQSIVGLNLRYPRIPIEIADKICLPDIVLYINVGAEIAAKRLFNRKAGGSRLDRMKRSAAEKVMIELGKKFNNCIEAIQKRTKVFRILSAPDDPVEEVALRVVKALREFLVEVK